MDGFKGAAVVKLSVDRTSISANAPPATALTKRLASIWNEIVSVTAANHIRE